jgi:hypothetical protein
LKGIEMKRVWNDIKKYGEVPRGLGCDYLGSIE